MKRRLSRCFLVPAPCPMERMTLDTQTFNYLQGILSVCLHKYIPTTNMENIETFIKYIKILHIIRVKLTARQHVEPTAGLVLAKRVQCFLTFSQEPGIQPNSEPDESNSHSSSYIRNTQFVIIMPSTPRTSSGLVHQAFQTIILYIYLCLYVYTPIPPSLCPAHLSSLILSIIVYSKFLGRTFLSNRKC